MANRPLFGTSNYKRQTKKKRPISKRQSGTTYKGCLSIYRRPNGYDVARQKDGTTTWEDAVQAVKDANPKP